jgi:hypothetical protein
MCVCVCVCVCVLCVCVCVCVLYFGENSAGITLGVFMTHPPNHTHTHIHTPFRSFSKVCNTDFIEKI